ncbi:response regulator [Alicyclobacillus shizuokensis]|uniref:response regulator n=1 Tax=Alicyclobacillus shizuokensis TaxID=392014 RepID=UPI0008361E26|nr:response regulator transcription factor [Alicyclobacillus shizuokensis]MCL6625435.1 response regulator transcription factor [Alicyclobacillus shizuokensis]
METQQPIRVAIADDNDQFRETLREVLSYESDLQVIATWKNGADAVEGLEHVQPDVLLLDINMPVLNGVEATHRLQAAHPDLKIIILSMYDDEGYVLETLKAGAAGYLVKDGSVTDVVGAIREVAAGRGMVHPQVTHTIISQFHDLALLSDEWKETLTNREMDVLRELGQGKSNEEIAQALGITEKTVKDHISNILAKLGVTDRTQAVVVAMKRRWIPS